MRPQGFAIASWSQPGIMTQNRPNFSGLREHWRGTDRSRPNFIQEPVSRRADHACEALGPAVGSESGGGLPRVRVTGKTTALLTTSRSLPTRIRLADGKGGR